MQKKFVFFFNISHTKIAKSIHTVSITCGRYESMYVQAVIQLADADSAD